MYINKLFQINIRNFLNIFKKYSDRYAQESPNNNFLVKASNTKKLITFADAY